MTWSNYWLTARLALRDSFLFDEGNLQRLVSLLVRSEKSRWPEISANYLEFCPAISAVILLDAPDSQVAQRESLRGREVRQNISTFRGALELALNSVEASGILVHSIDASGPCSEVHSRIRNIVGRAE